MEGYKICRFYSILLFVFAFRVSASTDSGDVPQFLIEPTSSIVQQGTSISLSCTAEPVGVKIKWLINGSVVTSQWHHGVDVGDGYLRIASFSKPDNISHEGTYQCLATTLSGTIVSREAKLEMAALGAFDDVSSVVEISVVDGNVALVPCYPPFSKPQAIIEFEFNGVKLVPSNRHLILPSGNLQILNTSRSDAGRYQCVAYNSVTRNRTKSSIVQKLIVNPPTSNVSPTLFGPSREFATVVLGHNLTLECATEGWPVPQLTWEKYGGQLPFGRHSMALGNLVIKSAQRFDAGTYLCKASSRAGQPAEKVFSVEILEPPSTEIIPASMNASEGSTVTFKCRAEGTPKAATQWFYNGSPVQNGNQISVRDSTLVLTNVKPKHRGLYQCIAKNGLGMAYSTVKLVVNQSQGTATVVEDSEESEEEADESSRSDEEIDDHDEVVFSDEHLRHSGRHYSENKRNDARVQLAAPSRPEVSQQSDTTVLVQWTMSLSSVPIQHFKMQYKEILENNSRTVWRSIGEDIPPAHRLYEVTRLKPGSKYKFRVGAIYPNSESRYSNATNSVVMGSIPGQQPRTLIPAPTIVELRPSKMNELFIGWQLYNTESWPVDGFNLFYAPFNNNNENAEFQRKYVKGASARHATLSNLKPGTSYSVKMQCYSSQLGEGEMSKMLVQETKRSEDSDDDEYVGSSSNRNKQKTYVEEEKSSRELEQPNSDGHMPGELIKNEDSQTVYIVLGVLLSTVFLITIVCIAMCIVRHHKQPRHPDSEKERKKLQGPEQSPDFQSTLMLRPPEIVPRQATLGKNHVPGCNGACAAANGSSSNDVCRDQCRDPCWEQCRDQCREPAGLPPWNHNGNVKPMPELTLPPPPPLNPGPLNGSIPDDYSSQQNLAKGLGHIYSRLDDQLDSSKSPSPSLEHLPHKFQYGHPGGQNVHPPRQHDCYSMQGSQGNGYGNSLPYNHPHRHPQLQNPSPDHIPRSYERHPYWVVEPQKRHIPPTGAAMENMSGHPFCSPSVASSRSRVGQMIDDPLSIDEEDEDFMRDQATNTDHLSCNDAMSVCTESDYNHYSSLDRRHSHDSQNTASPQMFRQSQQLIDAPNPSSNFSPSRFPRTNSSHCNGVRHESAPRGHPYGMSSPHGVPGNYEVGPHTRYKCYTPPGEILRDSQKNLSDYPPDALYNPGAAPYQRSFATQMSYE